MGKMDEALFNGAIRKLNFQVSGRISVVMSTFSVFGLSYGRSDNEFWNFAAMVIPLNPEGMGFGE